MGRKVYQSNGYVLVQSMQHARDEAQFLRKAYMLNMFNHITYLRGRKVVFKGVVDENKLEDVIDMIFNDAGKSGDAGKYRVAMEK